MLIDVQGFRPFDILPNELVVKIFTLTLAIGERHCKKPPSRGLLSHVCRRWKDVLQTHVCIAVPGYRHLTLSKYGLESGELTSRIYSLARFAGPFRLSIAFDMELNETDWFGELPALLSSLAAALGAAHRATIMLRLLFFPLEVLEFLITGSMCRAFFRIASLSISQATSNPTQRPAALAMRPTPPRFPLLSHLALLDTESRSPLSLQDNLWVWLFQPSICEGLLSLSVNPIHSGDLSWLLLQVPHLLDLRVSRSADLRPSPTTILHKNVKKLFLGRDYCNSLISCPNLTSLILSHRTFGGRTSLTWDPVVKITALSHPFTGNIATDLASYGLDFSFLTHMAIMSITNSGLGEVADIVGNHLLPNLTHLWLRLTPPNEGYASLESSGVPSLVLTANSLHQLTRARGGHPGPHTIDCRIPRRSRSTTSALFHLVRLLRQAAHRESVALDATLDQFSEPYCDMQSIEALLDAERSEVPLSEVAEKWTGLVKGLEKRIVQGVPAYELLTTIPPFWGFFERLKVTLEGTPFDLHENIIYQWKMEGELVRQLWPDAKKQWKIGSAQMHWRFEGVYWGSKGDSLIYNLEQEDHYYFTEHDNHLVFDHNVDGFLGEPSELVLRSFGVQC